MISEAGGSSRGELDLNPFKAAVRGNLSARSLNLGSLEYVAEKGTDEVQKALLDDPDLKKEVKKKDLTERVRLLLTDASKRVQTLARNKVFSKEMEKKGLWAKIKTFAKNNKIVTALLLAAAAAAGVGAAFYFTGQWELLMAGVASARKQIAAGVGKSLSVFDPKTVPLEGGGAGSIPKGLESFNL